MSRRSLRPQLNQIRGWVRQGRTDAWIAHQLEVTVQQIQAFKREQGLEPDGDPDTGVAVDFDDEIDLRDEGDAPPRGARGHPSKRPRTRGKRPTACGPPPPYRTIRSTPSTGPVTVPSR